MKRLIVPFALLLPQPALAQFDSASPPPTASIKGTTNDRRAIASPQIIAIISAAQSRPGRALERGDAELIRDLVMADGKIDDAEFDLLDEITSSTIAAVNIAPSSGKGPSAVMGTLSGVTGKPIVDLFLSHYAAQWDAKDTGKGWAEIVRQSHFSETGMRRVTRFLAGKVREAAVIKGPEGNPQKPLVDIVGAFYARNNKLPEAMQPKGIDLMSRAFAQADHDMNDALPDFLYKYMKRLPAE